jgi:hypothetical protein
MKTAEYPQRKCRMPVSDGLSDGSCEIAEFHHGPCADRGIPRSVRARDAWEEANPGKVGTSTLADPFHGEKKQ